MMNRHRLRHRTCDCITYRLMKSRSQTTDIDRGIRTAAILEARSNKLYPYSRSHSSVGRNHHLHRHRHRHLRYSSTTATTDNTAVEYTRRTHPCQLRPRLLKNVNASASASSVRSEHAFGSSDTRRYLFTQSLVAANNNNSDENRSFTTDAGSIRITKTSVVDGDSTSFAGTTASASTTRPYDPQKEELTALIDDLLQRTRVLMDGDETNNDTKQQSSAHHVIAFSGGIDSSLAAALVHNLVVGSASTSASASSLPYPSSKTYRHEKATAVLGLSPAVPLDQRLLAEEVASQIGIPFEQVSTTEGTDDVYLANDGKACLACKTHLYDNLKSIADRYNIDNIGTTILYNGTNAEDLRDPTRLGLIAASDFNVRSPLEHLSKPTIRLVGKHYFGLPNWDRAAAPCLRSRLAVGVPATSDHLKAVEDAEAYVKHQLGHWDVTKSLRVRILSKNRAMIEVEANDENDHENSDDSDSAEGRRHWTLEEIRDRLEGRRGLVSSNLNLNTASNNNDDDEPSLSPWKRYFQQELGFASVDVRRFKTGSVAPKLSNSLK